MLKPFLGIGFILRLGQSVSVHLSSLSSISECSGEEQKEELRLVQLRESESESDSGTGAEEQLRARSSVRLSRSLGLTLAWQVLRCVLSEEEEVHKGAGQSGQPCE